MLLHQPARRRLHPPAISAGRARRRLHPARAPAALEPDPLVACAANCAAHTRTSLCGRASSCACRPRRRHCSRYRAPHGHVKPASIPPPLPAAAGRPRIRVAVPRAASPGPPIAGGGRHSARRAAGAAARPMSTRWSRRPSGRAIGLSQRRTALPVGRTRRRDPKCRRRHRLGIPEPSACARC